MYDRILSSDEANDPSSLPPQQSDTVPAPSMGDLSNPPQDNKPSSDAPLTEAIVSLPYFESISD